MRLDKFSNQQIHFLALLIYMWCLKNLKPTIKYRTISNKKHKLPLLSIYCLRTRLIESKIDRKYMKKDRDMMGLFVPETNTILLFINRIVDTSTFIVCMIHEYIHSTQSMHRDKQINIHNKTYYYDKDYNENEAYDLSNKYFSKCLKHIHPKIKNSKLFNKCSNEHDFNVASLIDNKRKF